MESIEPYNLFQISSYSGEREEALLAVGGFSILLSVLGSGIVLYRGSKIKNKPVVVQYTIHQACVCLLFVIGATVSEFLEIGWLCTGILGLKDFSRNSSVLLALMVCIYFHLKINYIHENFEKNFINSLNVS